MQSQTLNLKFKGDRTYLQGGDIFNAVNRASKESDATSYLSRIAFRRFARRDCKLLWDKPAQGETLIAQGKVNQSGTELPFWIVESSVPAVGRYNFDEESLVSPAVINCDEIVLEKRSSHTPIEEIIALTKRLNYELTPNIEGKWVFGQLRLIREIPSNYSSLRICRLSEVANRFSVNKIIVDNQEIGDIRFIVGAP